MPVAEMQRLVLSETFETVVPLAGGTQLVFAKAVQDAKDGKEEDSDLTSLFFFQRVLVGKCGAKIYTRMG